MKQYDSQPNTPSPELLGQSGCSSLVSGLQQRELQPREALRAIHWGVDGVCGFWTKDGSGILRMNLGGVNVCDLLTVPLPFISGNDIYFTISSAYEKQRFGHTSEITGLSMYRKSGNCLRWLNALAVDFDLAHGNCPILDAGASSGNLTSSENRTVLRFFHFSSAVNEVLERIASVGLPLPSLLANSGRGLWALWLLADMRDVSRPVPAYQNLRTVFSRVARAAVRALASLKADAKCTDPARLMRVPGSINSCAGGHIVRFYRIGDKRYHLYELGSALGIEARLTELEVKSGAQIERSERHSQAAKLRWQYAFEGMKALAALRYGFRLSTRHKATFFFALIAKRTPLRKDLLRAVQDFAKNLCTPPLPETEVTRMLRGIHAYHGRPAKENIARDLGITEAEKQQLSPWFRPPRLSRDQKIDRRRHSIVAKVIEIGFVPSIRQMARALDVGHGTIAQDYQRMEIRKGMTVQSCMLSNIYFLDAPAIRNGQPSSVTSAQPPVRLNTSIENWTQGLRRKAKQ